MTGEGALYGEAKFPDVGRVGIKHDSFVKSKDGELILVLVLVFQIQKIKTNLQDPMDSYIFLLEKLQEWAQTFRSCSILIKLFQMLEWCKLL